MLFGYRFRNTNHKSNFDSILYDKKSDHFSKWAQKQSEIIKFDIVYGYNSAYKKLCKNIISVFIHDYFSNTMLPFKKNMLYFISS